MDSIKKLNILQDDAKLKHLSFAVDHECINYPDGMFFNIFTSMVCPFCGFVWGDITKHKSWSKLTEEQQKEILPIWKNELERKMNIYKDKFELHGDLPKSPSNKN